MLAIWIYREAHRLLCQSRVHILQYRISKNQLGIVGGFWLNVFVPPRLPASNIDWDTALIPVDLCITQTFSIMTFCSSALTLIHPTLLGVDMTNPVKIASRTSTSKRARSQDSQRLSNDLPASGTSGITEAPDSPNIPAFLHQSRFGPLLHEQLWAH